jgi:hypothetical protein
MRIEMKKKSAIGYNNMDKKSSDEEWNDDFGLIIIDVFEKAVNGGELTKTVEELINDIEIRFKSQ